MIERNRQATVTNSDNALCAVAIRPRRRRWTSTLGMFIGLVLGSIVAPTKPWLVWNVSASAPVGLYAISEARSIAAGETVLARLPETWRRLAASRRYIPMNVPLVKRIAAGPGDDVCAVGRNIFINGRRVATRSIADGFGRPMPWWSGCGTLGNGDLLLLMDNPNSFDGRYFGPTARGNIIGRARLIWRDAAPG